MPEWLHPENPEHRVPVLLDPGMIFGTGAHASTQMCMEELERADPRRRSRCWTSAAAAAFSPLLRCCSARSTATGVDIDPKAEDIARGRTPPSTQLGA